MSKHPIVRTKLSGIYYHLGARKIYIRSIIKKTCAFIQLNLNLLSKLYYQKRFLLRYIVWIKTAELKIFEAIQLFKIQKDFNKNPHRFCKKLFSSYYQCFPDFDAKTCEQYFSTTYSDHNFDYQYTQSAGIKHTSFHKFVFDSFPISKQSFMKILMKISNKCADGIKCITYLMYRILPCCANLLYQITCIIISEKVVQSSYKLIIITFIRKYQSNLKEVKIFSHIACSNVESKILWVIVNLLLTSFLTKNSFIKDHIQKWFLPNLTLCIEHSATLAQGICNARSNAKIIII